jgi:isoleucyl-tRNA synthetase
VLTRVAAPLLPLLTGEIWPRLTGGESVHLVDWPDPSTLPFDADLVAAMDLVRDVCSAGLSIRKAEGKRVRLPLASLTVASPDVEALRPFVDLIADEVNVKAVDLTTEIGATRVLQLNPRVLGPRVGADVQKLLRAAKDGDYEVDDDGVVVLGRRLEADEYELLLQGDGPGVRVLPGRGGVVTLDLEVTPELEAEGLVRDLVRGVNEARRTEGLDISDRIRLVVDAGVHQDVRDAVAAHEAFLKDETLAVELLLPVDGRHHPSEGHRVELADGRAVHVALTTTN